VEVRGYLELRMTFIDGIASRTKNLRYIVVNADSAYNILLGRPSLNRLRGGVAYTPYEVEAARSQWEGDRDQIRLERSQEVL